MVGGFDLVWEVRELLGVRTMELRCKGGERVVGWRRERRSEAEGTVARRIVLLFFDVMDLVKIFKSVLLFEDNLGNETEPFLDWDIVGP